jgi:hypothetical protein
MNSPTQNNIVDKDKKAVNKKIYESLLKRDVKEKHVTVSKLIQSNDSLSQLITNLKLEIDDMHHLYTTLQQKFHLQEKYYCRRIQELEMLLREKDTIIMKRLKKP